VVVRTDVSAAYFCGRGVKISFPGEPMASSATDRVMQYAGLGSGMGRILFEMSYDWLKESMLTAHISTKQ